MALNFHLIFVIFILFGINISKIIATDCEALSNAIKYYSDEEFKQNLEKELNCCYAEGVVCDESQKIVTGITLEQEHRFSFNSKSISDFGSFLAELGNINSLESIKLDGIGIDTTEIPSEIGRIKNLKELTIISNEIKHIEELANLKNLEHLDLSKNEIEGNIPGFIFKITSLRYLDLGANKLEGTIPNEIRNLVNLQTLSLYDNSLSGSIPNVITNMKNLKDLNLSKNQLEGYIPYEFKHMDNLKSFILSDNEKLKGYVPPIKNLDDCNYEGTNLCSLKDDDCLAPILCYEEEIEDTNKNNGSPNPNEYKDKAIKDKSEREVKNPGKKFSIPVIAVIVFIIIGCCGFCIYAIGSEDAEFLLVRVK